MRPAYIDTISQGTIERLYIKIVNELAVKQRYLDPKLTAHTLTKELNTNSRAFAAAMQMRFNANFSTTVNRYRVERAISMMKDRHNKSMTCEEIGLTCGFANRQSFYNAFSKITNVTPAIYRKKLNE
jgi:AraC-like DNA-binding protein